MPRKPTIRTDLYPYHVVARAHNKCWFPLDNSQMWQIYLEQLRFVAKVEQAKIVAFVLMNNHFHLMLWTPLENIDRIMYWIMKKSTLEVQKRAKTINSIYGGRYKSSLLVKPDQLLNAFKYIIRNPVVVDLCKQVEAYPYSTYHYSFYNKSFPVNINKFALPNLFDVKSSFNQWLNHKFDDDEASSIRSGLDRPKFKYAKDN